MKEYFQKNRDKRLEQMKKYNQNNSEKISKYLIQYYVNNSQKISEQRKESITCDRCGCIISRSNISIHKKTKKCLKNYLTYA